MLIKFGFLFKILYIVFYPIALVILNLIKILYAIIYSITILLLNLISKLLIIASYIIYYVSYNIYYLFYSLILIITKAIFLLFKIIYLLCYYGVAIFISLTFSILQYVRYLILESCYAIKFLIIIILKSFSAFSFKRIKNKYANYNFYKTKYIYIIIFFLNKIILVQESSKKLRNTFLISKAVYFFRILIENCLFLIKFILLFLNKILIKIKVIFYSLYKFIINIGLFFKDVVKYIYYMIIAFCSKEFWSSNRKNLLEFIKQIYNNVKVFIVFIIREFFLMMAQIPKLLKLIILFLYYDILQVRSFRKWIRQNYFGFITFFFMMSIIVSGSIYFFKERDTFVKLTKLWENSISFVYITKPILYVVEHQVFQPIAYYNFQFSVEPNSNLYNMLIKYNIEKEVASNLIRELNKNYNLRNINPNWVISAVFVSSKDWQFDKIQKLSLPIDYQYDLIVEADQSFNYSVYRQEKLLSRYIVKRKVIVENSIYESAIKVGIPNSIVSEVFKVLSWDIDFQRDIKSGDSLEVIFECLYNQNDTLVTCDNLLFVNFKTRRNIIFYKFEDGYYHPNGNSVVKTLIKTPVNNARLSSTFGNRTHPILGYTLLHKGIDFAAPVGTPIYASGDGIVESKRYSASYGNVIVIRHNNSLKSLYAHMHGFAKDLKVGDKVKQWQLIGYVGSTGRSTGPHLHYEVLVNGQVINPLTMRMSSNIRLENDNLRLFNIYKENFDTLAIRLPVRGKVYSPYKSSIIERSSISAR